MKKILILSNHGMGFYNFKFELVERLIIEGYEVHFCLPPYSKLNELVKLGAIYHPIDIDRRGINPLKDIKLLNEFRKLVKNVKPDLMVMHTIKPNIYSSIIAKYNKIPYINNITGLGSALQSNSIISKLLVYLYKISLSSSQAIFFENEGNKYYFKRNRIGNDSQYIVVSGAGVNLTKFKPEKEERNREKIVFLFIGRIMKDKGINEYFEAAKYITKEYDKVEFQVVGFLDDESLKSILNKYVDNEVINFLGMSNDTRIEMKNSDCIVLPSYHEGMSNVLLEGAAMGMPLITTNINGCKEIVDDCKNGFLCEPKDTESLKEALIKFIHLSSEQQKEMGCKSREKVEQEFNRDKVIDKYVQCINSVFEKKH